jgi:hypothetical protein
LGQGPTPPELIGNLIGWNHYAIDLDALLRDHNPTFDRI